MKTKPNFPRCLNCKRILKPALDMKNDTTGKWDKHSFRCSCWKDKKAVLSIG